MASSPGGTPSASGRGSRPRAPFRLERSDAEDAFRTESERLRREADRLYRLEEYAQAEDWTRRLIRLQEQALGRRHPEYATGLSMLAELRFFQDDLDEAEALFRQVLAIRVEALGDRHPDTASSLGSLAALVRRRGDLEQAEALLQRALEIRKRVLGPYHPDALKTLTELGRLRGQRRRARARAASARPPAPAELPALTPDVAPPAGPEPAWDGLPERPGPSEPERVRAVSVLDRVLALAHVQDTAFAPLRACQEKADALRAQILTGTGSGRHADVQRLAEGDHPFAQLVRLVEEGDALSDALWTRLHEAVVAAYGIPLARAASCGRLVSATTAPLPLGGALQSASPLSETILREHMRPTPEGPPEAGATAAGGPDPDHGGWPKGPESRSTHFLSFQVTTASAREDGPPPPLVTGHHSAAHVPGTGTIAGPLALWQASRTRSGPDARRAPFLLSPSPRVT